MRKRRVPILLALVLFLSIFLSSESVMVTRAEITSDSIKEKQKQISQTQDEQKKIQQGLSDIKKMKKELETSKSNLEAYVTQLDGDLNVITAKIEELQGVIDETQVALDEATNDYNEAVRVETEQYEAMKVRIQFMYEKGNNFLLDAILGAQSFSEILNRANYYEEIAAYDRKKLDEYVLNRQMVEACKEQIEAEKAKLDEAMAAQEAEQANLEALIGEKEQQINAVTYDINNKEAAIQQYEDELEAMATVISQLEAQV
ncbi:MAG: peptidase M23, partial [Lachnospiraceae bacterium]|nr:peptidase M23 [Lachnospiraceae bacterium]